MCIKTRTQMMSVCLALLWWCETAFDVIQLNEMCLLFDNSQENLESWFSSVFSSARLARTHTAEKRKRERERKCFFSFHFFSFVVCALAPIFSLYGLLFSALSFLKCACVCVCINHKTQNLISRIYLLLYERVCVCVCVSGVSDRYII